MSRMNRNDASTMPTPMAMIMSKTTVREKHVRKTSLSAPGARCISANAVGASLMFHATMTRIAAIDDIGM